MLRPWRGRRGRVARARGHATPAIRRGRWAPARAHPAGMAAAAGDAFGGAWRGSFSSGMSGCVGTRHTPSLPRPGPAGPDYVLSLVGTRLRRFAHPTFCPSRSGLAAVLASSCPFPVRPRGRPRLLCALGKIRGVAGARQASDGPGNRLRGGNGRSPSARRGDLWHSAPALHRAGSRRVQADGVSHPGRRRCAVDPDGPARLRVNL